MPHMLIFDLHKLHDPVSTCVSWPGQGVLGEAAVLACCELRSLLCIVLYYARPAV